MTTINELVTTTAGFGAGKAIVECMKTLRLAGHYAAVDLLSDQFHEIRTTARDEAAETAQGFAQIAHADIIAEALRDEPPKPAKLPKSWPFPVGAEEALI